MSYVIMLLFVFCQLPEEDDAITSEALVYGGLEFEKRVKITQLQVSEHVNYLI